MFHISRVERNIPKWAAFKHYHYPMNAKRWFIENTPGHDFICTTGPFEDGVLWTYVQKFMGEDYKPLVIREISSHEIGAGPTEVWLAFLVYAPLMTVCPQGLVLRPPKLAGLDIMYTYDGLYHGLCDLAAKQVMDDKKDGKVK